MILGRHPLTRCGCGTVKGNIVFSDIDADLRHTYVDGRVFAQLLWRSSDLRRVAVRELQRQQRSGRGFLAPFPNGARCSAYRIVVGFGLRSQTERSFAVPTAAGFSGSVPKRRLGDLLTASGRVLAPFPNGAVICHTEW